MADINNNQIIGYVGALTWGRTSKALSDADYTVLVTEYIHRHLEFTGTLTATRVINLPLADGAEFAVANLCTGGSLTFKVTGQTGVTVAAGKRAIIYGTATDYVRLTADV